MPDQRRPARPKSSPPRTASLPPKVEIWKPDGERTIRLTPVPETDPIFDCPEVDEPDGGGELCWPNRALCASCARNTRLPRAGSIRHSRLTVMPSDLYVPRPADTFSELRSDLENTAVRLNERSRAGQADRLTRAPSAVGVLVQRDPHRPA